jgi:hypothetical protein
MFLIVLLLAMVVNLELYLTVGTDLCLIPLSFKVMEQVTQAKSIPDLVQEGLVLTPTPSTSTTVTLTPTPPQDPTTTLTVLTTLTPLAFTHTLTPTPILQTASLLRKDLKDSAPLPPFLKTPSCFLPHQCATHPSPTPQRETLIALLNATHKLLQEKFT